MPDKVVTLGQSIVQHGSENDRVYLIQLSEEDMPWIVGELDRLAEENGYGKIFAKVPETLAGEFLACGYIDEARIPCFYEGETEGVFLGRYFDRLRRVCERADDVKQILDAALARDAEVEEPQLPPAHEWSPAEPEDVEDLAALYGKVFASYPFPIHDPSFIRKTMDDHTAYYLVRNNGKLVAASSAEMYSDEGHVEMTDFATLPECRGKGLASYLLRRMEGEMEKEGMFVSYTIARAMSPGMNMTFAKAGYLFGGTLINNTNIAGRLECMNVWHKRL